MSLQPQTNISEIRSIREQHAGCIDFFVDRSGPVRWQVERIVIVLASAVASTFTGSSGLGWMMLQFLDRKSPETTPASAFLPRNMKWIVGSVVFIVAYAAVFGRTLQFN